MTTEFDVSVVEMQYSTEGFNDANSGLDIRMKHIFKNFSLIKSDLYKETFDEEKGSVKVVRASDEEIADLLVNKTSVSTVRYDTEDAKWYIYDLSRGCFQEVQRETIESMISFLLKTVNSKYMNSMAVRGITSCLRMHNSITIHRKCSYDRFLVFKDGIFDLASGLRFPHTPRVFVTEGKLLPYPMPDWDKILTIAELYNFVNFMKSFTDSNLENIGLIRFIMKTLFIPRQFSKILIISGYSGTGKSAFVRLLQSLIGMESSISTSFKLLKESRFETSMFRDKKLVIFSDTQVSESDMSILKDMTGGDGIAGEEKHKTRKSDFFFTGLIVIITNDNVVDKISRDESGALRRRIILLKTLPFEGVRVSLLDRPTTQPVGVLAKELPHIVRWVLTMNNHVGQHLLEHKKFMFDASHTYTSRYPVYTHVLDFAKKNFIVHPSSRVMLGWDSNIEGIHKRWLSYVDEHGLSFPDVGCKLFTDVLLLVFGVLNLEGRIIKKRTSEGVSYKGIRLLNPTSETSNVEQLQKELSATELSKRDSKMSFEENFMIFTETERCSLFLEQDVELLEGSGPSLAFAKIPEYSNHMVSASGSSHISFSWEKRPIELYKELFHVSVEREMLSLLSKTALQRLDVKDIVEAALHEKRKNYSEAALVSYATSFEIRCKKDLKILLSSGFLVYAYIYSKEHKSNRIYAYKHGKTVHAVTRVCREAFARAFAVELKKKDLLCVSIDVKACFFNLLIGLIPQAMEKVSASLKNNTIWQVLESDMSSKVKDLVFDKPAVKICLYSKLFGAGKQSMVKGILNSEREKLVASKEEFENMDIYPYMVSRATEIVDACEATDIFLSLNKAKKVIKEFVFTKATDRIMTGPAGLEVDFKVLPFNSAVSCFLQDYEISIVANLGLFLKREMGYFEPCIHLHDGLVCVIKKEELNILKEKVKQFEADTQQYFHLKNNSFGFDVVIMDSDEKVIFDGEEKRPDGLLVHSPSNTAHDAPSLTYTTSGFKYEDHFPPKKEVHDIDDIDEDEDLYLDKD
jgi:phage/plasmid-associated DNA primase